MLGEGACKGHLEVGIVLAGRGLRVGERDKVSRKQALKSRAGDRDQIRAGYLQYDNGTHTQTHKQEYKMVNFRHMKCHTIMSVNKALHTLCQGKVMNVNYIHVHVACTFPQEAFIKM